MMLSEKAIKSPGGPNEANQRAVVALVVGRRRRPPAISEDGVLAFLLSGK
jgi:hypothetical protein